MSFAEFGDPGEQGERRQPKKTNRKSKTPILDNFSRDITDLAKENKVDPVIGRENEIERVCQILSRKKKNNPVLIGKNSCLRFNFISCWYKIQRTVRRKD